MCWLQVIINHFKPILEFEIYIFESKKQWKTVLSKKAGKKFNCAKNGSFKCFAVPKFFQYLYLMFYITKPSYVINIYWKFEDFLSSSLGVIKVLHISNRSKDGVNIFIKKKIGWHVKVF